MLLVHGDDSFLQLIEAAGTPTSELRLPPEGEFDVDLETLIRLNEEHDSHIVGPSLEEDEARAFVVDGTGEVTLGPVNHISVTVTDVQRSAVVRRILRPGAGQRRNGGRRERACPAGEPDRRMDPVAHHRRGTWCGPRGRHLSRSRRAARVARCAHRACGGARDDHRRPVRLRFRRPRPGRTGTRLFAPAAVMP